MPLEFALVPAVRAAAWAALVAVGLWTLHRRRDAAGRAFAFWAFIWAGGIQLALSVQAMATDPATQQVWYRVAYYAILFSSSAFLAVLLYVPRRHAQAGWGTAAVLAVPALLAVVFAADHGAFLGEASAAGTYVATNIGAMQVGFPVAVWTGFLAAMLWLAWKVPGMARGERGAATWLMAGLALFAADRFARTAALWVRDPTTLGPGLEGQVYGLFMLLFGAAVLAMVVRARPLAEGANVSFAALLGGAVGATAIATYGAGASPTEVPVLLSALLAPVYGRLLAQGVLDAPAEAIVPARRDRAAVLSKA